MSEHKNRKIHIISLGCSKNQVDSEYLLGRLLEKDYTVTDDPAEAGVILINTCAFIQPAVEESVETILEAAEYKTAGQAWALVVAGCLPQRYADDLNESLPEVDLFCGTGEIDLLPELLEGLTQGPADTARKLLRPGFVPDGRHPRVRAAPFFRAYLKIAEGCSNACSYCLIPRLRGPYASIPLDTLLGEAEALAETGVKELILVAQDTTAYGLDLDPPSSLALLLARLADIPGIEWLRVMYAYPTGLTDSLLDVMAGEPKICDYLDLPLQHSSPRILEKMGRDRDTNMPELIRRLREKVPGLILRTTIMVGYPGETESDFAHLLDFVKETRFDHLGVFKFSPEAGTLAAKSPDQVQQRIKENRRRKIMALQRRISRGLNKEKVGRIFQVLIEGPHPETELLQVGRTREQAPEVDSQVIINNGMAQPGEIVPVLITEAHDYDLLGEIVVKEKNASANRPLSSA
ncbi:MAG: 30S ribosomal protein S12 methylthiotransferase RimO [Deltaproteobacteria bacterium]|nr:30S ribosomal protein S12 methylthiotransferase RimO [Deltaproteobacteria bacterium]